MPKRPVRTHEQSEELIEQLAAALAAALPIMAVAKDRVQTVSARDHIAIVIENSREALRQVGGDHVGS